MSVLVSVSELKSFLGDAPVSDDDAVLTALLDDVEASFTSASLRTPGFYTPATTARTEVLDGTGSTRLYLTYPISVLTSVKLGYNAAAPTETLSVSNTSVLVYGVGSRVITRTDGGKFGTVRQPRYVQVVYDHAGNMPDDARMAIKSVAAMAYRRRGSEEAKSETIGAFYSRTMIEDIAASDPWWAKAVQANMPVVLP